MGLEADCMDLLPSGKRASETILHGGVLVAGRKVWAEELTCLHVYVDEAGDHWARLFKTNQDEDNRATITSPPPPVTPRYTLPVHIDALTDNEPVSDAELQALKVMVQEWVEARKSVAEVVDLDADDEPPAGNEDGAGGGGRRTGAQPAAGTGGGPPPAVRTGAQQDAGTGGRSSHVGGGGTGVPAAGVGGGGRGGPPTVGGDGRGSGSGVPASGVGGSGSSGPPGAGVGGSSSGSGAPEGGMGGSGSGGAAPEGGMGGSGSSGPPGVGVGGSSSGSGAPEGGIGGSSSGGGAPEGGVGGSVSGSGMPTVGANCHRCGCGSAVGVGGGGSDGPPAVGAGGEGGGRALDVGVGGSVGRSPPAPPPDRHPLSQAPSDDEIQLVRRRKQPLWSRRRSSGKRARGGSLDSDSQFSAGDLDDSASS
ncbi:hypothetical protein I4F81_000512 [Pyropia yezoensis]|uniref:Uncharacterized protein n=1 Tax=Pyropia yezoensis TaxID=2788 RepID=A0ACC3BJY7_PYRYE|nr:hypothetical protein I4F81_000512 [Neopyropia yezoensis]